MRNLKRVLSLGMTAAMITGLMVVGTSAAGYSDVSTEDNVEAIEVLQSVGVMVGDENGDFNPDQLVTRNEMAALHRRALLGRALCGCLLDQRHHRRHQRHHLRRRPGSDHCSGRSDADEGSGLLPV